VVAPKAALNGGEALAHAPSAHLIRSEVPPLCGDDPRVVAAG
jgi:hypothetical protein